MPATVYVTVGGLSVALLALAAWLVNPDVFRRFRR